MFKLINHISLIDKLQNSVVYNVQNIKEYSNA